MAQSKNQVLNMRRLELRNSNTNKIDLFKNIVYDLLTKTLIPDQTFDIESILETLVTITKL